MKKDEVISYCIQLQDSIHGRLEKALQDTERANANIELLTARVDILESEREVSKHVTKALTRQIHQNSQYLRKESLEIHGVEDEAGEGDELEINICKLLSMSGEKVVPDDLQACHRLANKKQVICKLKCRKQKFAIMKRRMNIQDSSRNKDKNIEKQKQDARKKLSFGRVWINESLAPHFKSMQWKCRMLQKHEHIHSYWFFNGHLQIKLSEASTRQEIIDDDDLEEAGIGIDINAFLQQYRKK